jgi:single-strand DNA-binding protein
MRIASSRKFKTQSGIKREEVCYVNVTAWMSLAQTVKKVLTKGDTIYVEGRLQSRNWTGTAGENKNTIEILAEKIQFLSKKDTNTNETEEVDEIFEASSQEN